MRTLISQDRLGTNTKRNHENEDRLSPIRMELNRSICDPQKQWWLQESRKPPESGWRLLLSTVAFSLLLMLAPSALTVALECPVETAPSTYQRFRPKPVLATPYFSSESGFRKQRFSPTGRQDRAGLKRIVLRLQGKQRRTNVRRHVLREHAVRRRPAASTAPFGSNAVLVQATCAVERVERPP